MNDVLKQDKKTNLTVLPVIYAGKSALPDRSVFQQGREHRLRQDTLRRDKNKAVYLLPPPPEPFPEPPAPPIPPEPPDPPAPPAPPEPAPPEP